MQIIRLLVLSAFVLTIGIVHAQTYSIVIKGGQVIDPKNKINELMDIAIKDGRIVQVAKNIDPKLAKQVVNAEGMYVTPRSD